MVFFLGNKQNKQKPAATIKGAATRRPSKSVPVICKHLEDFSILEKGCTRNFLQGELTTPSHSAPSGNGIRIVFPSGKFCTDKTSLYQANINAFGELRL